jgi:hypothetical protein
MTDFQEPPRPPPCHSLSRPDPRALGPPLDSSEDTHVSFLPDLRNLLLVHHDSITLLSPRLTLKGDQAGDSICIPQPHTHCNQVPGDPEPLHQQPLRRCGTIPAQGLFSNCPQSWRTPLCRGPTTSLFFPNPAILKRHKHSGPHTAQISGLGLGQSRVTSFGPSFPSRGFGTGHGQAIGSPIERPRSRLTGVLDAALFMFAPHEGWRTRHPDFGLGNSSSHLLNGVN